MSATIVISIIFTITVSLMVNAGSFPYYLLPELCKTEDCLLLGNEISATLNTSFDPCTEFYKFSCQGWISKTIKPKSMLFWNHWQDVELRIIKRVQNILKNTDSFPNKKEIQSAFSKARKMYKSCTARENTDVLNIKELKLFIDQLGGWPMASKGWSKNNYHWLHQVAEVTKLLNVHPILKLNLDVDAYNKTNHILYLSQGEVVLPLPILLEPNDHVKEIKVYENWMYQTVKHLYKNNLPEDIKSQIWEVIDFETKLANLIVTGHDKTKRASIGAIIRKEKLDLLTAYEILFNGSPFEVSIDDQIIFTCENYLKKISHLVRRSKPRILANYIIWHAIKELSRDTSKYMRSLSFAMDNAVFDLKIDTMVEDDCGKFVMDKIGLALVPIYEKTYLSPKSIPEVEEMIRNIQLEFAKILERNKWLDDKTKKSVVEKILALQYYVGYPDWIKDVTTLDAYFSELDISDYHFLNVLSVKAFDRMKRIEKLVKAEDKIGWWLNPFEINAGYSILTNAMIIPLAMLDKPFFDITRPHSINYGSIGSIIGHELSHALDDKGRKANKDGLLKNWWSENDIFTYNEKIGCFEKQYNSYGTDGYQTIGENIADNVGLKISFVAFKQLRSSPSLKVLPGLNDYSDDQLFFISFAQTWCELPSDNKFLQVATYAPEEIRVLASVYNNEDFKDSFQCENDNKYICNLWYSVVLFIPTYIISLI